MAKSKSGGSRSYLRGKLGSDVYSIGKDGKGKKQQVVRALAETVANPQTQAQMRGRMIMSTVMQAQSQLTQIIDHSFDGFPAGQPSISQFIRANYALIKADVAAHPSADNTFGLVKYGEKGAKGGRYQVSDGKAQLTAQAGYDDNGKKFTLGNLSLNSTVGGLIEKLALQDGDFLTCVQINNDGTVDYVRLKPDLSVDPTTAMSAEALGTLFSFEGTQTPTFAFAQNTPSVAINDKGICGAIIVSRKNADGYTHNKAFMYGAAGFSFTAAVALPTYPVGSAKFLNGGDVPGLIEG